MDTNRGIVILALGNSLYYGYARNLAATIRAYDMEVSITVFCDDVNKAKFEPQLQVNVKHLDEKYYTLNNQFTPFMAKLLLPKFTPYKKTLYLDADMAWLYHPTYDLFNELDGVPFAIANGGAGTACIWANTNAMKKAYGDAPVYHLYSECIYFESGEIFKAALPEFKDPKVNTIPWAGGKCSDEFAFIAAIMKTGILPHKDTWLPIFWYHRDKRKMAVHPAILTHNFYGYSLGGNSLPEFVKRNYNIVVNAAFARLGLRYPQQATDKRKVIAERRNI